MSSIAAPTEYSQKESVRLGFRRETGWVLLTALICAHFSLVYNMDNRPFLDLAHYAAGQERSPFQERVLMAWIFRFCASSKLVVHLSQRLPIPLRNPYLAIQLIASFAGLSGSILFTRGSIRQLTRDSNFSRWAGLLVAFMAYFNLPLIYGLSYTLPYDIPSLFFFSGCVYCVLRRNYFLFYPLFILGTLNRETICFVTIFFLVWEMSMPKTSASTGWRTAAQGGLQAAIWLSLKFYLSHLFALNPHESAGSSLISPHLQYNLHEILKPQQWPLLLSTFGFTLPLLVSQRKWIQDRGISRSCAIILPLWLCLMFYAGVIIEIRIYTELISIVSLGVSLIAFHRWKAQAQSSGY